jgi:beta-lactamase class A
VTSLPLLEALRLMIALSDNDATNAVLDHARLLETARSTGCSRRYRPGTPGCAGG